MIIIFLNTSTWYMICLLSIRLRSSNIESNMLKLLLWQSARQNSGCYLSIYDHFFITKVNISSQMVLRTHHPSQSGYWGWCRPRPAWVSDRGLSPWHRHRTAPHHPDWPTLRPRTQLTTLPLAQSAGVWSVECAAATYIVAPSASYEEDQDCVKGFSYFRGSTLQRF